MTVSAVSCMIGTDRAYGVAVLLRDGKEIKRTHCNMFPSSWFEVLQEFGQLGDMVEVRLGKPLNRTEKYYMATANHNGFVTGYMTEVQWNWKPKQ